MKDKVKIQYKNNYLKAEKAKCTYSLIKLLIAKYSSPPKMATQLTSSFSSSVVVI